MLRLHIRVHEFRRALLRNRSTQGGAHCVSQRFFTLGTGLGAQSRQGQYEREQYRTGIFHSVSLRRASSYGSDARTMNTNLDHIYPDQRRYLQQIAKQINTEQYKIAFTNFPA